MRNILVLGLAALCLTACASTPNPLALTTRDGFYVKQADVVWKVDESKRTPNAEYDAGKADLQARLKTSVENEFKTSPSGSEAAIFEVDVTSYSRVGAAMGNIIGGSNMVVGDVHVLRASDHSEIAVYKGVYGSYTSNGGIIGAIAQAASKPDIVGIMANTFAADMRKKFDSK
ncbi:MAG TPA: hypothetical protein VG839_01105 [Asticcacaulis sp.]|nr:hypothetical protein [Asticcacaulis sp.]